jgi:hypothetical protein
MLMKVLGAIIVIWVAFAVIGFIFEAVVWLLIVGAVVAVIGGVGYAMVKGGKDRKQIH